MEEMALATGISRAWLYKLEAGCRQVDKILARRIEDYFLDVELKNELS
jgi:hypothetical protein